ncbi:hypothetical protein H8356DRAFT_923842 [Neocallimastix lanati (nom. inval.)]|uniref:C1q domain-containing protein n=1 Tax=Neocallimastix californiae TaxID=1754190 RepID=A0A1Y2ES44_9FUNG|nr:hypothetical protein H8356DRAFT_923842 [Neocallimastix sp. JGI-2020a]ORY74411.1 hypothetical protein LY90DRAFT_633702 [Neocallimastix californiae]|eukprot:ORY74411.1 hypothetical protein LY90DRAFT_633702 [Neocallimastix californiae]
MDTIPSNDTFLSSLIDCSNEVSLNKSLKGILNIMLDQNKTIKYQAKIIQDLQNHIKYIEKEVKKIKTDEIKDAHEALKEELRKEMILFVASTNASQIYSNKKKKDSIANQLYKTFINVQLPYQEYNKIDDDENIMKLSHRIVCQNGKNKELYTCLMDDVNQYAKKNSNLCNHSTIMENQNTINEIKNSLKKIQNDCSVLQINDPSSSLYQDNSLKKRFSSLNNKYDKLVVQMDIIKSALIANNMLKMTDENKDGLDAVPVMSISLDNTSTKKSKDHIIDDENNCNISSEIKTKDFKLKFDRIEKVTKYIMRMFNLRHEDLSSSSSSSFSFSSSSSNILINHNSPLISYLWTKIKNDTQSIIEEKLEFLKNTLDSKFNSSTKELWNHLDENIAPFQQQIGNIKNILTELTKKLSYDQYILGEFYEKDERYLESSLQLLFNNDYSVINYYKGRKESQKYFSLSDRVNIVYDAIKQLIHSNLKINQKNYNPDLKESLSNDSLITKTTSEGDVMEDKNCINHSNTHHDNENNDNNNSILAKDITINDIINRLMVSPTYKDKIITIVKETLKPKLIKIKDILHEKIYNTDGHNFIWEMNSSCIKVQNEGIYEISFSFFTKVKPTIKLIINGETVMSAINSSSYVVHHSSGYILANGKLKPGSSTGLSLILFKEYETL